MPERTPVTKLGRWLLDNYIDPAMDVPLSREAMSIAICEIEAEAVDVYTTDYMEGVQAGAEEIVQAPDDPRIPANEENWGLS
jgi:hypothetical protein